MLITLEASLKSDEQQQPSTFTRYINKLQKTLTPNTGDAVMEDITFTPRSASWVQLVVDQAGGFKEIEVYYDLCMKGKQFLLALRRSHYWMRSPPVTGSYIYGREEVLYSWFSHDVTKIRTTKLLIFLRFYLNDV